MRENDYQDMIVLNLAECMTMNEEELNHVQQLMISYQPLIIPVKR